MIGFFEFREEMVRLHRGFGAVQGDEKMGQKITEWYEQWKQLYPETAFSILKSVVDRAIASQERLPSFAQLRAIRDGVVRELPRAHDYSRYRCSTCDSSGVIYALKKEPDGKTTYRYAFRCNRCENGKIYSGIPVWQDQLSGKGFWIETTPDWDEKNAKALLWVKELAPKMYEKIIEGRPELVEVVEFLELEAAEKRKMVVQKPLGAEVQESARMESVERAAIEAEFEPTEEHDTYLPDDESVPF